MITRAVSRPSYALAQERLELSERLIRHAMQEHVSLGQRTRALSLHRRAYLSHLDRYLAWTQHATPEERVAEFRAWSARPSS